MFAPCACIIKGSVLKRILERIKQKDPLPRMKAGAGDAFKNYLRFNEVWKRFKTQQGLVSYSFRHSYSKQAHQSYKLSDTEVAAFMGHSVPVHNSTYAQWSTESMLEKSMQRVMKFRELTKLGSFKKILLFLPHS